jgi:hypothetical protein
MLERCLSASEQDYRERDQAAAEDECSGPGADRSHTEKTVEKDQSSEEKMNEEASRKH